MCLIWLGSPHMWKLILLNFLKIRYSLCVLFFFRYLNEHSWVWSFCVKMLEFFFKGKYLLVIAGLYFGNFCGNKFTFTLMFRPGCERVFISFQKYKFCPSLWAYLLWNENDCIDTKCTEQYIFISFITEHFLHQFSFLKLSLKLIYILHSYIYIFFRRKAKLLHA